MIYLQLIYSFYFPVLLDVLSKYLSLLQVLPPHGARTPWSSRHRDPPPGHRQPTGQTRAPAWNGHHAHVSVVNKTLTFLGQCSHLEYSEITYLQVFVHAIEAWTTLHLQQAALLITSLRVIWPEGSQYLEQQQQIQVSDQCSDEPTACCEEPRSGYYRYFSRWWSSSPHGQAVMNKALRKKFERNLGVSPVWQFSIWF